nr:hypothetical protein Iba_scaffold858900CG0010 [Ipomoea batatas]
MHRGSSSFIDQVSVKWDLLSENGKSLFPASVAGFIHANMRKLEFLSIQLTSPFSVKQRDPFSSSSTPITRCKVSGGARFTSSSNIQSPFLRAVTKAPSTNENIIPAEALVCARAFSSLMEKFSHSFFTSSPKGLLRFIPEPDLPIPMISTPF